MRKVFSMIMLGNFEMACNRLHNKMVYNPLLNNNLNNIKTILNQI